MHMPICFGPVISKKIPVSPTKSSKTLEFMPSSCFICDQVMSDKPIECLNCQICCHVICMSKYFRNPGEYVPVEGKCPKCDMFFLWGDLVRKYKGCYNNIDLMIRAKDGDDFLTSD